MGGECESGRVGSRRVGGGRMRKWGVRLGSERVVRVVRLGDVRGGSKRVGNGGGEWGVRE